MNSMRPRRRGLVILGVVMADVAFNLCLQALVDDFQEDRRLVSALQEARAELERLQEEIDQAPLEEPRAEGRPFDPPAGEIVVDAMQRVFFAGDPIGDLSRSPEDAVERLRTAVDQLPPGRLRLRLDRRLPVDVYARIWPAVAGRPVTLAVD